MVGFSRIVDVCINNR